MTNSSTKSDEIIIQPTDSTVNDDKIDIVLESGPTTQDPQLKIVLQSGGDRKEGPWIELCDFEKKFFGQIEDLNQPLYELFNETVSNLLRNREALSVQLALANGNISEDDFVSAIKSLAVPASKPQDLEESADKLRMLFRLIKVKLDAETIATLLNIDHDSVKTIFDLASRTKGDDK